ncbi:MAG: hypothetical protein ACJ8LG_06510 [Massilia sp.]
MNDQLNQLLASAILAELAKGSDPVEATARAFKAAEGAAKAYAAGQAAYKQAIRSATPAREPQAGT